MNGLFVAALLLGADLVATEAQAQTARAPQCSAREHRQLDFWAGDWDVCEWDEQDKVVARARVEGDRMVLTGTDHGPDGRPVLLRGVRKAAAGGVRETADTSGDGGKTWKPWFDLLFRAHKP